MASRTYRAYRGRYVAIRAITTSRTHGSERANGADRSGAPLVSLLALDALVALRSPEGVIGPYAVG